MLEGLVAVVPSHVPALRMLEQLHRRRGAHAPLGGVLRAEAEVLTSSLARAGALWEMVALEEHLGTATTLEALGRLAAENPRDAAALDATVRIAGKLVTAGVGVPHPAAIATRARLVPAIKARKDLTRDPVARAIYQIEEAMLVEAQAPEDTGAMRAALAGYQAALGQWPESLLAARGLERLAERLGDRQSLILSQLVLSRLAERARARRPRRPRRRAHRRGPADQGAGRRAPALRGGAAHRRRLPPRRPRARPHARRRRGPPRGPARHGARGRDAARSDRAARHRDRARHPPAARGPAGRARGSVPATTPRAVDAGIGVTAMRHVLSVTPDDVAALLLMARLQLAQRLWAEARDTLLRVVSVAPREDVESRVAARFLLADIYETRLGDPAQAQSALQAILALDDKNRRALERLVQIATAHGDRALVIQTLNRLAEATPDPAGRVEVDMRLADVCRDAGDAAGRVRALADAVATAPHDARAWTGARAPLPHGGGGGRRGLRGRAPAGARDRVGAPAPVRSPLADHAGHARGDGAAPPDAGHRPPHPGHPDPRRPRRRPRAARARARGRGPQPGGGAGVPRRAAAPRPTPSRALGELPAALASLEAALAKEGRVEERLAVEEVRACLGEVKPDRMSRFRSRRLGEGAPYAGALAGQELVRLLLPEARTIVLEVSTIIAPIAAKILRFELSGLGVGSRDRLSPRDGHPTRVLADRIARALGIESFEIYLSASWQGAARVYPGDPPAIVGSTSFAELPEDEQLFALARLLTRASRSARPGSTSCRSTRSTASSSP